MNDSRYLNAVSGDLVSFNLPNVTVSAGVDDDGQPYVTINTEGLEPQYTYDGGFLRGTASPFQAQEEGDYWTVRGPSPNVIVAEFAAVDTINTHQHRASFYAAQLNNEWPKECGTPVIQVMLNNVTIYNDEGPKTDA